MLFWQKAGKTEKKGKGRHRTKSAWSLFNPGPFSFFVLTAHTNSRALGFRPTSPKPVSLRFCGPASLAFLGKGWIFSKSTIQTCFKRREKPPGDEFASQSSPRLFACRLAPGSAVPSKVAFAPGSSLGQPLESEQVWGLLWPISQTQGWGVPLGESGITGTIPGEEAEPRRLASLGGLFFCSFKA